jgi:hypothetical protein
MRGASCGEAVYAGTERLLGVTEGKGVAIRGRCRPAKSLGAVAKSASRASERGIALELVDVVRGAKAVHVGDVAVVDVCVALLSFCRSAWEAGVPSPLSPRRMVSSAAVALHTAV